MDNLNPSCPECNMNKGACSLEFWRQELSYCVNRCNRDHKNFRLAVKFNQVIIDDKPIVFYFETLGSNKR